MTPDFQAAAIRATETLIKHRIVTAPIDPMPILKTTPGVLVLSFTEIARTTGEDRGSLISTFNGSQDAVTTAQMIGGKLRYIVAYNQRLPFYMLQRGLARELGHIILHHDGSRPDEVRTEEALCFARHLICPRPIIRAIQDSGIRLSIEALGNITGCYERCLSGIRKTPGVSVPPELNCLLRDQFADYIQNFVDFQQILSQDDETPVADLGTYMDNYSE